MDLSDLISRILHDKEEEEDTNKATYLTKEELAKLPTFTTPVGKTEDELADRVNEWVHNHHGEEWHKMEELVLARFHLNVAARMLMDLDLPISYEFNVDGVDIVKLTATLDRLYRDKRQQVSQQLDNAKSEEEVSAVCDNHSVQTDCIFALYVAGKSLDGTVEPTVEDLVKGEMFQHVFKQENLKALLLKKHLVEEEQERRDLLQALSGIFGSPVTEDGEKPAKKKKHKHAVKQ